MKIQVIQNSYKVGTGQETYPWPKTAATFESAKGQIKRWLEKVAQHHGYEIVPQFKWFGHETDTLTFSRGTEHHASYQFELRDLDNDR